MEKARFSIRNEMPPPDSGADCEPRRYTAPGGAEEAVCKKECAACVRRKNTPRSKDMVRSLQGRLNRIIGQLNGVKAMLDDNRYCGDILIQISAAESALKNIGYAVLQNHLETCVAEEIKKDNPAVIGEAVSLIRRLL